MTKRNLLRQLPFIVTSRVLRLLLFLFGSVLFLALALLQWPKDGTLNVGSNLLIFVLVNLNVIFICVLGFLVVRNITKLAFDRRRNILGSKLKLRLAGAFVGLTLVPTVILFVLASELLNRAMEGWFSGQLESPRHAAVDIAHHHYNLRMRLLEESMEEFAKGLKIRSVLPKQREALRAKLDRFRRSNNRIYSVRVVQGLSEVLAESASPIAGIEPLTEAPLSQHSILKALGGEKVSALEERGASKFVRAYVPLEKNLILVGTALIEPEVSNAFQTVIDSFREYEQLKLFKQPLRSGYILLFSLVTLVILFAALWAGFYIARQIVGPIERLAEGTKQIASGNYDVEVEIGGDDEIGYLVKSFNRMTADIRHSREESEQRRIFIEAILSNLAVGVMSLDHNRVITSVNRAAAHLFHVQDGVGKPLVSILTKEQLAALEPLLLRLETQPGPPLMDIQLSVVTQEREHKIVCTGDKILDSEDNWLATVLLFDDITELSKAQQMSAWREVARRIAHEIKNPLTPIQLSAQRLQKIVPDTPGVRDAVRECVSTIVENVDSIKRLANEFSNFARMPTAELRPGNLNAVVSDVLADFAENYPRVTFRFIADSGLPDGMFDGEQMRRLLINLVDNAIAATTERDQTDAKVVLKTLYDKRKRAISIEVADNGPGIKPADKTRIFDPYFTTKKSGTGLGLAIVTSIVSDHQGRMRVLDNAPKGTRFVIEFPLEPQAEAKLVKA